MLTALILTLNEADIIERCLSRLSFVDEIIVLDSGSTDNTVEICLSLGATVEHRKFDNYANQRNYGLSLVRKGWILMLDADEMVEAEFRNEIQSFLQDVPKDTTMGLVRRKDIFFGKWLRFAGFYPTWIPRMFKADSVSVERSINEEYHSQGKIHLFQAHIIHFPFHKGCDEWYIKHMNYSSMEAEHLAEEKISIISDVKFLVSGDKLTKRAALKRLSFHLPLRTNLLWFYLVIFKLGFLDGPKGLLFISMRLTYEKVIIDKIKNIRFKAENSVD